MPHITPAVPRDLRGPVGDVGFGNPRAALAAVPVPKAPMYKDDFASLGKHQIRLTGEIGPMEAESKSQTMGQSPY